MSEPGRPSEDRVAGLVAALLGVRTDHASARFDAEIEAALTANRLDVQTARALRFWQRASVQAVEDYATAVLPTVLPVLAAAGDANEQGADDSAETATAWDAAQLATAAAAASPPARREVAIRYITTRHRSAKETEQAVRAAFRARGLQTEERAQQVEEDRDHARATTSA